VCQEISAQLHDEACHADQEKYASLHRKRNGVVACIAAIRALKREPNAEGEGNAGVRR
jgi:hypothetical protein